MTYQSSSKPLKYPEPSILLMDFDEKSTDELLSLGHNVTHGSFGKPYKVKQSSQLQPLLINRDNTLDHTEYEIVAVNLIIKSILSEPDGEKLTPMDENDWWASCNTGVIDPRPRLMASERNNFDRILKHGGIFIIFASRRSNQDYFYTSLQSGYVNPSEQIPFDNWSFLGELLNINVNDDPGKRIVYNNNLFGELFDKHLSNTGFRTTLDPSSSLKSRWIPLAHSIYGDCVAAALAPKSEDEGWIFIFPPVVDSVSFLSQILTEILPYFRPKLFPHIIGNRWLKEAAYELPSIVDIQQNILAIRAEADIKIGELNKEIEEEREKYSYLHDLLIETDDKLVHAVQSTLQNLGFKDVVNMDKEIDVNDHKREDLQIRDSSPLLVVEVKGVNGIPKDTKIMQAAKYIAPTMQRLNRTDVKGLSILNHQRHVRALDRDNPFREDIVINAQKEMVGLLSTWDLFKLTRNFIKLSWTHEQVKDLFYQSGIIRPIPTHFIYVGIVEKYWEKVGVVGVRVENDSIGIGSQMMFELPVDYEVQIIKSLQVDGKDVTEAKTTQLAGIKTDFSKTLLTTGTRVYIQKPTIDQGL